jgi:hypothetical protein
MANSLVNEHVVRARAEAAPTLLRWLPSLTSFAFLLPLVLLYWQVGRPSALLTDPIIGVDIRIGQWILSHHAIPHHGLFSFTLAGRPWCDWEWLSDVLYALLFRIHGLSAIVAFHLGLLCLVSVILYRTARLRAGRIVAFAATCLVMAATTIHWLARPHLITWLFLAIFCFLLERADVTGDHKPLLVFPLLMVLWVNLHPGFVAGLLVLGVWCAHSLVRYWSVSNEKDHQRRKAQAFWFGLLFASCLAATVVNPYFWHLDAHIASYLFSPKSVTSNVAEWLSPDFRNPRLHWFELFLPLAAAAGVWQGARGHIGHCSLVFGWMHLALMSVRNVPLFAIVCAAPLAAAGGHFRRRCRFGHDLRACEAILASRRSRHGTIAVYGLACALLAGIFLCGPSNFGPPSSLPVNAVRHLPAGRLFTTDRWADYLIYLELNRQVFFDGRNDAYGAEILNDYLTVMRAQPSWQNILLKYQITAALVPPNSSISASLMAAPRWVLTYQDRKAVIYVRGR